MLLKNKYNAITCFNDVVAIYFMQKALTLGISIPKDLSITGFDNSSVRNLFLKKIDTIQLSVEKLGEEAGAWLKRRIIDKEDEIIQKEILGDYVKGETV